jgi:hypothetical protein
VYFWTFCAEASAHPVPASPEKTYGQETFGKKLVRDWLKKVQIEAEFVYVEFAGIAYGLER